MIESDAAARAFAAGCDARLAGLPLAANPYTGLAKELHRSWERGWADVDRYWGSHLRRLGLPMARPLPAVREAVEVA